MSIPESVRASAQASREAVGHLVDVAQRPWPHRLLRVAGLALTVGYFGFIAIVLALRYLVLPQIEDYRDDLERALSSAVSLPVTIERIGADWQGLRPRLELHGLEVHDQQGRSALRLDNVEAVLSWTSLLYLEPRLHRLEVRQPMLDIRRDARGEITIAGLPLKQDNQQPGAADWVLRQDELTVRDARITWTDDQRGAPALTLAALNLTLQNGLYRHRFGLTATPPADMAGRIDVRGDFKGNDFEHLADWHGQIYANFDYADLAVWRRWIDYPIELPAGHGRLRCWLDVANLQPQALTASLGLSDVQVRFAKQLPMLSLSQLQGRITARRAGDGFELETRQLGAASADGTHIEPSDTHLRWQPLLGEFSTSRLDLGAVHHFAEYLPLPAGLAEALKQHGPQGRLSDFRVRWNGLSSPYEHYQVDGRFDALALNAVGDVPGGEGISGTVQGDETGGSLQLDSKNAALHLPAIFVESRLPLDSLKAEARWKWTDGELRVDLAQAQFSNADAEGSAKGSYRRRSGSGVIDLDATLPRASGNAVWRYLPKVIGPDVPDWLKTGVPVGHASNVSLKLKGDLDHFPFSDGSGTFRIRAQVKGAIVKPAPEWPSIDDINGELLFEGARMKINASQGRISGATLSGVVAEIPDLERSVLTVTGKAKGDTSSFLGFIEASPVGERIEHFTRPMQAKGNGELDLKLVMPLVHIVDTRVSGNYRFDGVRVAVNAVLPPLEDVRGRLEFTDSGLTARDIRARSLGGPLALDIRTGNEGALAVDIRGEANVAQARTLYPTPLFDHLSGSTRWDATVRVKKNVPEVRVQSDLRGIASSLPEPFNKSASEARPLLVERKYIETRPVRGRPVSAPASVMRREQWDISLKGVRAQFLRSDAAEPVLEQGFVAIGSVAGRLPDKGVAIQVELPRVDIDFWRPMLASLAAGDKPGATAAAPEATDALGSGTTLSSLVLDLKTPNLAVFGRNMHDVRLLGSPRGDHWNIDLRSREIGGRFDWWGEGKGKLAGRVTQFSLPVADAGTVVTTSAEDLDQLPALDLTFDRFVAAGRDFGEVKLAAENKAGTWVSRINVQNEDGTLSGDVRWKPDAGAPDTAIDFKLKARSLEHFLDRMGYANTVRRGTATLEGQLNWNGAPFALDYPTLAGNLKLDARDGQFRKLEPGVGRLLGVISLQSLPRRVTLDFRDVFSEGFAFDAIQGHARIARGIVDTDDLEIRGPAAQVAMKGSVDLSQETQNLTVRVQPALGESVATGILFIHPVTGITTWAVNKLFGRPLDQIFAYEYGITGSWVDPKVAKLGGGAPKASPPVVAPPSGSATTPAPLAPLAETTSVAATP